MEPKRRPPAGRWLFVVLLCAMLIAGVFLQRSEAGRHLLQRRRLARVGEQSRAWVAERPVVAPIVFVAAYITCALLALPVWWLKILAGHAFGLVGGIAWSLGSSAAGAAATVAISHWAGGDWVHARAGPKLARYQRLAESLGHHGLSVVIVSRLCFVLPYGLGNYLMGLAGIRARDAALGTLVGNLPITAVYVAIGARPGLVGDWRFWAIVGGAVVVLVGGLTVGERMVSRAEARRSPESPVAIIP